MASTSYVSSLESSPEHRSYYESVLYFSTLTPVNRMLKGVSYVYSDVIQHHIYPTFTEDIIKNTRQAIYYRTRFNKLRVGGKPVKAMKNILLSINVCPDNSHLDIAIGNRSVLLYTLNDYISALVDVNRVLKNKRCSKHFLLQMEKQKSKIVTKLNQQLQQNAILKKRQYKTLTDPDTYNAVMYRIKQNKRKLKYSDDDVNVNFDRRIPVPFIYYENNFLPNASAKIKISKNQIKNRYIEAKENVDTGEILIVEKPLVSALYSEHSITHCSNCFVRCTSLIPCSECSTMYCSEACYDEARSRYHNTECRIFQFKKTHKLSITNLQLMALRLFLIGTEDGTLLKHLMSDKVYGNPCSNKDFNFESVYVPEDYFNIHNLEDHYENVNAEEWHNFSEEAAFLLFCLKKISFFNVLQTEKDAVTLTRLEEYVGSLLLKFLLCVSVNSHEVIEFMDLRGNNNSKELPIGSAVYPTLRFASHSCCQNTVRYFHRNYVVVRASRPISVGEEIFDNYGHSYVNSTLKLRQKYLEETYFFKCQCIACIEKWPLLEDLPFNFAEAVCLKPREEINMGQIKEWSEMYRKMTLAYSDQAICFCYTYASFLYKTFKKPFREHTAVDFTIQLLLSYRGNYYDYQTDVLFNF